MKLQRLKDNYRGLPVQGSYFKTQIDGEESWVLTAPRLEAMGAEETYQSVWPAEFVTVHEDGTISLINLNNTDLFRIELTDYPDDFDFLTSEDSPEPAWAGYLERGEWREPTKVLITV